jgi:hypothetical protein
MHLFILKISWTRFPVPNNIKARNANDDDESNNNIAQQQTNKQANEQQESDIGTCISNIDDRIGHRSNF